MSCKQQHLFTKGELRNKRYKFNATASMPGKHHGNWKIASSIYTLQRLLVTLAFFFVHFELKLAKKKKKEIVQLISMTAILSTNEDAQSLYLSEEISI